MNWRIISLLVVLSVAGWIGVSFYRSTIRNSPPKQTGGLVMAADMGPVTLDPIKAMDVGSGAFLPLIHAPLLLRAADGTARPILAESLSMTEDCMSCTIRLRSGARFWDGSPVTTQDVAYSLTRFGRSGHPFAWAMNRIVGMSNKDSQDVSGLHLMDERTLEVRFSTPDPDWPWFIATPLVAIVKKGSADSAKENFDLQVVGAGPYRPAGFEPGSSFHFVRNEGFPISSNVEKFEIRIVESPQRQLELADRGEIDIVRLTGPMIGEATTSSSGPGEMVPHARFSGMKLMSAPANEELFVLFNVRSGPLGSMPEGARLALKEALGARLAKKEVIEKLYGPFAHATRSISPKIPLEAREGAETGPGNVPEKVRLLVPNSTDSRRLASLVAAQGRDLGIGFEVSHAALPDAVSKAISGDFDAMVFWIASQPAHQAVPWSMFFDEGTGFTALGQAIPNMRGDVERARGIQDPLQREEVYAGLIRTASARQSAWVPIASRDTVVMVPESLQGELLDWNGVVGFYGVNLRK
jgi:ABC-type transport system substrate-binding protein